MTDKFFDAMAAATIMADGAGFTPTTEQLAAINSGVTAADVEQITTNKNNISSIMGYTQIESGTNLNTLTDLGKKYQCSSAATAVTLTNCPTNAGFMLYVRETASTSRYIQEIIANETNEVYRRWLTSGGWSSWYKYVGTPI